MVLMEDVFGECGVASRSHLGCGDDMQGVNFIGAHAWLPFYALKRILINSYLHAPFDAFACCPPSGMNDILCFRTVLFSINRQVPLKAMSSAVGLRRCYGIQGEQRIDSAVSRQN